MTDPTRDLRVGLCVVARWEETFDWSACPWPVRIVQKGIDLPNAGREAASYAWWVATHHDQIDPDGTYAFLQGNPFPHAFTWDQLRLVDRYEPLGGHHLRELPDGSPNHPGLPLDRAYRVLGLGDALPDEFCFPAGAQFLAPGRALLRHSADWWRELQARTSDGGWLNPWVMERLWPHVIR